MPTRLLQKTIKLSLFNRLSLAVIALVFALCGFYLLSPLVHGSAVFIFVLPAIVAGWLFGKDLALISGAVIVVASLAYFRLIGFTSFNYLDTVLSSGAILAITTSTGFFRHLVVQLDRQSLLLETHVAERNAELVSTHQSLQSEKDNRLWLEDELQRNETTLRNVIQNIPGMILSIDPTGKVILLEGRSLPALGMKPEALLGQNMLEPDTDRWGLRSVLQNIIAGKQVPEKIAINHSIFTLSATRIEDGAHKFSGAVVTLTDITEKELRYREQRCFISISTALQQTNTPRDALSIAVRHVVDFLPTTAAIGILNESGSQDQTENLTTIEPDKLDAAVTRQLIARARDLHQPDGDLTNQPVVPGDSGELAGWRFLSVAPFSIPDGQTGLLVVASRNELTASDMNIIEVINKWTTLTLESIFLYQNLQTQVQRLKALHAIDESIIASSNGNSFLQVLVDQTILHMKMDAAVLLQYQTEKDEFVPVIAAGADLQNYRVEGEREARDRCNKAPLNDKIISCDDPAVIAAHWKNGESPYRLAYIAPLQTNGSTIGMLQVFRSDSGALTKEQLDFLHTLAGQASIALEHINLLERLQSSNEELSQAYDNTLESLAFAMELRDVETRGHSQRVSELTVKLARHMGIPESECAHIRRGALLHDLGKLSIPDSILLKEGPLNHEEQLIMQRHPLNAFEMLNQIAFLRPSLDVPLCHHERWDGTGYPNHLKGEDIPLNARIFAVVDVWDALCSDRPYRSAWPQTTVLEYIMRCAGSHFDPVVVQNFMEIIQIDSETQQLLAFNNPVP